MEQIFNIEITAEHLKPHSNRDFLGLLPLWLRFAVAANVRKKCVIKSDSYPRYSRWLNTVSADVISCIKEAFDFEKADEGPECWYALITDLRHKALAVRIRQMSETIKAAAQSAVKSGLKPDLTKPYDVVAYEAGITPITRAGIVVTDLKYFDKATDFPFPFIYTVEGVLKSVTKQGTYRYPSESEYDLFQPLEAAAKEMHKWANVYAAAEGYQIGRLYDKKEHCEAVKSFALPFVRIAAPVVIDTTKKTITISLL